MFLFHAVLRMLNTNGSLYMIMDVYGGKEDNPKFRRVGVFLFIIWMAVT